MFFLEVLLGVFNFAFVVLGMPIIGDGYMADSYTKPILRYATISTFFGSMLLGWLVLERVMYLIGAVGFGAVGMLCVGIFVRLTVSFRHQSRQMMQDVEQMLFLEDTFQNGWPRPQESNVEILKSWLK